MSREWNSRLADLGDDDDDERQMLCCDDPHERDVAIDTPLQRGLIVGGIAAVGVLVTILLV
jgi:hypothetical protein